MVELVHRTSHPLFGRSNYFPGGGLTSIHVVVDVIPAENGDDTMTTVGVCVCERACMNQPPSKDLWWVRFVNPLGLSVCTMKGIKSPFIHCSLPKKRRKKTRETDRDTWPRPPSSNDAPIAKVKVKLYEVPLFSSKNQVHNVPIQRKTPCFILSIQYIWPGKKWAISWWCSVAASVRNLTLLMEQLFRRNGKACGSACCTIDK